MSIQKINSNTLADGAALNSIPGGVNFRNRIINGDMRIDQRNAGASVAVTTVGVYSVDRFRADVGSSGTGRFSVQQSSTAPTGFVNSIQVTVTTADESPSANFGYSIQQLIEGFNTADLALGTANAKPVTLSFWVRSSVVGTFPVTFVNEDSTRTFGAQYTISAANTWEHKTILVSGLVNGTWLTNNGLGIRVVFGLGGGTNRTMSLGYQTTTGLVQTNVTGSTQLIATSAATWQITGVQLEAGSVATPFERRPFGTELALCQRYFYRVRTSGNEIYGYGYNTSTTEAGFGIVFKPSMRSTPTLSNSAGNTFITQHQGGNATPTGVSLQIASTEMASVLFTGNTGLTAGQGMRAVGTANSFLSFSSEL